MRTLHSRNSPPRVYHHPIMYIVFSSRPNTVLEPRGVSKYSSELCEEVTVRYNPELDEGFSEAIAPNYERRLL